MVSEYIVTQKHLLVCSNFACPIVEIFSYQLNSWSSYFVHALKSLLFTFHHCLSIGFLLLFNFVWRQLNSLFYPRVLSNILCCDFYAYNVRASGLFFGPFRRALPSTIIYYLKQNK